MKQLSIAALFGGAAQEAAPDAPGEPLRCYDIFCGGGGWSVRDWRGGRASASGEKR